MICMFSKAQNDINAKWLLTNLALPGERDIFEAHSDDDGLVMPPALAAVQVVVVRLVCT